MLPLKKTLEDKLKNPKDVLSSVRRFRWPSFAQWRRLPRVLTPKEKVLLPSLILVSVVSLFVLLNGLYIQNTSIVPARGGHITEGIIGSPRFINPVYADANDVDRDLIELIFSGLLRYDGSEGFVPDLAEKIQLDDQGKVYTIDLKKNVQWHDGEPFTVNDVIFTIATIQDPKYKSPIRANWIGVNVERVSDFQLRFHLLDPYAPFVERLTLKIIPVHIWGEVNPENFPLSPHNLQPIGTGPYKVTKIDQERSGSIKTITLSANSNYHKNSPFLESITFRFLADEKEIAREANRGTIQTFTLGSVENIAQMKNPSFTSYSFSLPRYFALFFNQDAPPDQKIVERKKIRQALRMLLDKDQINQEVFGNRARIIHSPFLPDIFNIDQPQQKQQKDEDAALALLKEEGYIIKNGKIVKPVQSTEALQIDLIKGDEGSEVRKLQQCLAQDPQVYPEGTINGTFGPLTKKAVISFQEKYADEVLAPIGLTSGTGKAGPLTREKLNALCFTTEGEFTPLKITITTGSQSPLKDVAEAIKKQWEASGVQVEIRTFAPSSLEREVLKPRAYQVLLFGEILGKIPDPFPFWHSSQIKDPGLNLSSYENKQIDKLLEAARKESDEEERARLFGEMQDIILEDVPAIFLYDLDFVYFASKEIQSIEDMIIANPSQRFLGVSNWYTETKRAAN